MIYMTARMSSYQVTFEVTTLDILINSYVQNCIQPIESAKLEDFIKQLPSKTAKSSRLSQPS